MIAAIRAGCGGVAGRATRALEPLLAEARRTLDSPAAVVLTETEAEAVGACIAVAASGGIGLALTSGAGLAACAENLSLAAMAELPLVLVHCQLLGADDGGVTLPGDTDVSLARRLLAGGLPLPVLAAADVASAYRLTVEAFSLAKRLRMPVVLLVSPPILSAQSSFEPPASGSPTCGTGIPTCGTGVPTCGTGIPTCGTGIPTCGTGVSPVESPARRRCHSEQEDTLLRPSSDGRSGCVHFSGLVDGSRVVFNVDPATIEARLSGLRDKVLKQGDALEYVQADADPDAETLLLSYGLADDAARQAVQIVRGARARVSHLTIYSLWPVPEKALRRALTPFVRRVLVPEINLGLYADELRSLVHGVKIESLASFDGRLIEPQTIAERITAWPCG